jgi:FAD/FMN-containing dehydrogenase
MEAGELARALRAVLPHGVVITGDDERADVMADALGESRGFDDAAAPAVMPLVVVRATTTEQVAAAVRVAGECGVSVVPRGGGTGLMGGARSLAAGIVLDLRSMNRVREIDAVSGWAWVEAGAVLSDVNDDLAPHGLTLGHDPWTVGIATIGGAISTNGLGFLGGKYGSMGQQVLAIEAVLADGTVVRTRPAQPHSTGIDLNHLFIAGEGSLGVITAAAVRAFPIPESSVRSGFRFVSFEAGFEALLKMRRIGLTPAVLDYGHRPSPPEGGDGGGWEAQEPTLYLGFLGLREEVAALTSRASAICVAGGGTAIEQDEVEEFWSERHVPADRFAERRRGQMAGNSWPGAGRCFDYVHVSLPVSAVLEYRIRALAIAAEQGVDVVETGLWVHAGLFSMVLVATGEEAQARMSRAVDAILRLAISSGGSMEYCHGVGVRLAHLMREEHGEAGVEVMRRVKAALDAGGVLNAGKFRVV